MPPPAKVLADADVRLIVPVPVTVRFVDTPADHAVAAPEIVQVPEPIASVLTFVLLVLTKGPEPVPVNVTLYVAASKVPEV